MTCCNFTGRDENGCKIDLLPYLCNRLIDCMVRSGRYRKDEILYEISLLYQRVMDVGSDLPETFEDMDENQQGKYIFENAWRDDDLWSLFYYNGVNMKIARRNIEVWGYGKEKYPCGFTLKDVSKLIKASHPTASRILRRFERAGVFEKVSRGRYKYVPSRLRESQIMTTYEQ